MPDFIDDLSGALGNKARVGSTKRSVEEQESLYKRGATRARGNNAPHVREVDGHAGAADILGFKGSPGELEQTLVQAGFNVARVRRESGKGPNQGTGAHDHVEFGPSGKSRAMVTIDPNTAINGQPQGQGNDPLNPFQGDTAVRTANSEVTRRAQAADEVLTRVDSELQQVQDARLAQAQAAAKTKEAVYSDIQATTEEVQNQIKPLFGKRAEIAKRKSELANMNPIARDFMSIFNPNYSKEHLDEVDEGINQQIQVINDQYQTQTKLADTMLGVITGRYTSQEQIQSVVAQNAEQDLNLANQSVTTARQMLSDSLNGISAGVTISQAQGQARATTLSQMQAGDLNSASSEAQKNGGKATINGVELSLAEIRDRQRQLEQQDIAVESQKLAIQGQRMNIAEAHESNLISHMSTADINQAMSNGGVFKGVKLDQIKLTSALQASVSREGLLVTSATNAVDPATFTKSIDALNTVTQTTATRMASITGVKFPGQMLQHVNGLVAKADDWQRKIHAAAPEAQGALRMMALRDLSSSVAEQDKVIDKTVQGMSKDPDVQIMFGAFIKGNVLTPEQTAKGLVKLARGGAMPPGIRLEGPAAAAFQAAKSALDGVAAKYDPANPKNRSAILTGQLKKPNQVALQNEEIQAVTAAVSKTWINGNTQRIVEQAIPAAAAMGHPFGKVSPGDWRVAYEAGRAARAEWVAKQPKPTTNEERARLNGQAATTENTAMLRALDQTASAQNMSVKPSAALVDFYKNPRFQQQVGNYNSAIGSTGLGAMISDNISGGGLGQAFGRYASQLSQAQAAMVQDDNATIRSNAANYMGSPYKRAAVILGAIPGLNPAAEQQLLTAIQREAAVNTPSASSLIPFMPNAQESVSNNIDNFILHGKFQDPALEKLRKTAAQHWEVFSQASDRAVDRLHKTGTQ